MKDTLVYISQNFILCCDITNDELPNINGMFNTASMTLAFLDPMQSRADFILVMGVPSAIHSH